MDLVIGTKKKGKCTLTLVERKTRKQYLAIIKDKSCASENKAMQKIRRRHKAKEFKSIFKTITVDNGSEFQDYKFIESFGTQVYYFHPYCSFERGTNENQNKLVRRHLPKGLPTYHVTNRLILEIQVWINDYPRRNFAGLTPNIMFFKEIEQLSL